MFITMTMEFITLILPTGKQCDHFFQQNIYIGLNILNDAAMVQKI